MTITIKTIILTASIAALTACGGTTIDEDMNIDPPGGERPNPLPSTLGTTFDVQTVRNDIGRGFNFQRNSNFFGPKNGNVTYSGDWVTGINVAGSPEINGLFGDMTMRVDIGGDNNPVTGSVTNLNTTSGNTGLERLQGALTISGNIDGTDRVFDRGTMRGDLNGYFGGNDRRNVTMTANIETSSGWRDSVDGARGDVITGRTNGTVNEGDFLGSIDITTGLFRVDRN